MNALQQFLLNNPVDNIVEEVIVSDRLKEFKFKIKAVTNNDYTKYQTMCIENPNSPKKRKFNTKKFNELIVINHTIDPNFKDAEWIKEAQCIDSVMLLNKTLLSGETTELSQQIMKLSGFDDETMEEDVEEVKN